MKIEIAPLYVGTLYHLLDFIIKFKEVTLLFADDKNNVIKDVIQKHGVPLLGLAIERNDILHIKCLLNLGISVNDLLYGEPVIQYAHDDLAYSSRLAELQAQVSLSKFDIDQENDCGIKIMFPGVNEQSTELGVLMWLFNEVMSTYKDPVLTKGADNVIIKLFQTKGQDLLNSIILFGNVEQVKTLIENLGVSLNVTPSGMHTPLNSIFVYSKKEILEWLIQTGRFKFEDVDQNILQAAMPEMQKLAYASELYRVINENPDGLLEFFTLLPMQVREDIIFEIKAKISDLNKDGIRYYKNGDHDSAIAQYDKAIEILTKVKMIGELQENNISITYNKARALHQKGDVIEALILYENIINIKPAHLNATKYYTEIAALMGADVALAGNREYESELTSITDDMNIPNLPSETTTLGNNTNNGANEW